MIAGDRNHNSPWVDAKGSIQVGFGEHELDAFGRLDVQEATTLAYFDFNYDKRPEDFDFTTTIAITFSTISQDYPDEGQLLLIGSLNSGIP